MTLQKSTKHKKDSNETNEGQKAIIDIEKNNKMVKVNLSWLVITLNGLNVNGLNGLNSEPKDIRCQDDLKKKTEKTRSNYLLPTRSL